MSMKWTNGFFYFLLEPAVEAETGKFACTVVRWSYPTVSAAFVACCGEWKRWETMIQMKHDETVSAPCLSLICQYCNWGRLDFRTCSWHCWVLLCSVAPTLLLHFDSNVFPSWRPLAPWRWRVKSSVSAKWPMCTGTLRFGFQRQCKVPMCLPALRYNCGARHRGHHGFLRFHCGCSWHSRTGSVFWHLLDIWVCIRNCMESFQEKFQLAAVFWLRPSSQYLVWSLP